MPPLKNPINRIIIIDKQKSPKFIYEFNNNKVTKEFMTTCEKAGRLFNKRA